MSRQSIKKRMGLAVITLMTMIIVSGCGTGKMGDSVLTGKTLSQTEDTPWNNGYTNVMETEDGYYYNIGCMGEKFITLGAVQQMNLRYYDKTSGTSIMLCNKPECTHTSEEGCIAVYKDMKLIGTKMYDGEIYVYGTEEENNIISLNLYRIAADGSAMDKVGTAFSSENTLNQEYEIFPDAYFSYDYSPNFCIHRGYAYLPYRLQIGQVSRGFMGSGLVKMNILTGEVETIYEVDTKLKSYPISAKGAGDYVYVEFCSVMTDTVIGNMKRYSLIDGSFDFIDNQDSDNVQKPVGISLHTSYGAYTDSRLYNYMIGGKLGADGTFHPAGYIYAYDVKDGSPIGEETISFEGVDEAEYQADDMFVYDRKLFLITPLRVLVFELAPGENYGAKLGEISYELENPALEKDHLHKFYETFKISGDKLYHVHRPVYDKDMKPEKDGLLYSLYTINACKLEDLYNGTAKWEKVFTYECCRE